MNKRKPDFGGFAKARQAEAALPDRVPDDLVEVGYVSGAWGVRGWVKIQPHAADADALLGASVWWLGAAPATVGVLGKRPEPSVGERLEAVRVTASRMHSGTVVAQFAQCADRDAAEACRGRVVHVSRADFPVLESGEYYWVDLIGVAVSNLQGEALGTVSGLMDNGAHQLLRVAPADASAQERLIPFVDHFVREVDLQGRRVVVDWGLDF